MKRSKGEGLFVTFEGIDGTGKTTCLRGVAERLHGVGLGPLCVRLPGSSNVGLGVRSLLFVEPSTRAMEPGVADLLFLVDHIQVTERVIKPALMAGHIVLCDRYTDSQIAYSTHPSKLTPLWASELYGKLAVLEPDLTFLLMCDSATAWARSKAAAGKEAGKVWEGAAVQTEIQSHYLKRLRPLERARILKVDLRTQDEVAELVTAAIMEVL